MPCVFRLYKSLKKSGVEKRFKTPFLCRFSGRSGSPGCGVPKCTDPMAISFARTAESHAVCL